MASRAFLHGLYDAHAHDLAGLNMGSTPDSFVCPICLGLFERADIDTRLLTDGHVWPKGIRESSAMAKRQRVLLCKTCNNNLGSRGDKQMQSFEKLEAENEPGQLQGERRIELLQGMGNEPVRITAAILRKGNKELTITGSWKRSNPSERRKFETVVKSRMPTTIVIHQPQGIKPDLVRAGWVTSAYLLAFYALGYRYIGQSCVEPVRDYIANTMHARITGTQLGSLPAGVKLQVHKSVTLADPELNLVFPSDRHGKIHLEASFRRYRVSLPIALEIGYLRSLLAQVLPDIVERLRALASTKGYIYVPIQCTKLDIHECVFDCLMGKPCKA